MSSEPWYIHFESQWKSNQREIDSLAELVSVYDELLCSSLNIKPNACTSSDSKWESACRQKAKQIESQQALLTDLQAELGAKEAELKEMTSRFALVSKQADQLQNQLHTTHDLLNQKSMEILRLQTEIRGYENWDQVDHVQNTQQIEKNDFSLNEYKSLQLGFSTDPNVIVSSGDTVLIGSRKAHCINAGVASGDFTLPSTSVIMSMDLSLENALMGTSEGQLCLLELATGRWLKDLKGHGASKVKGCGFLESSTKAFSVATDRTLKVWDLNRGSPIRSVPVVSQIVGGTATNDGSIVATCHQNGGVCLWSMNEKICQLDRVHPESCLGIAISQDGRFLISLGKDNSLAVIDVHMAQAGPVHRIGGFTALSTDNSPAISPDSRIVSICSDIGIQTWDILLASQFAPVHTDSLTHTWTVGKNGHAQSQEIVSAHPKGVVKWWKP